MVTGNAVPEFTDRDVHLIKQSLPGTVDPTRLEKLPRILREWSHVELREHLSREPRAIDRDRRNRLKLVGKRASELLQALDALDEDDRFGIVLQMAGAWQPHLVHVSQDKLAMVKHRLEEEPDFLSKLMIAAPSLTSEPGRGRPRNIIAYLVMMDLAAIFKWLTGSEARRVVDRESGEETGPFARFAAAVWPVVFGQGDDGLGAALKNWASARNKFREESALIANIAMRQQTWRKCED
jgi:hypothetical protein